MSDAVRELEVELHGFYIGAPPESDRPHGPHEVRPCPLLRFHSGEVVATLNLTGRDVSILARQLQQGIDAPRANARLAAALVKYREETR